MKNIGDYVSLFTTLEVGNIEGYFSENVFLLLPYETKEVKFIGRRDKINIFEFNAKLKYKNYRP